MPKCEIRIWARRLEVLGSPEIAEADIFADTDIEAVVAPAELIVLAMPIHYMAGLVKQFPALSKGTVVTDVGSTKATVVEELSPLIEELGGVFIGSHPMAGSEKVGIEHSREDLFEGAAVVLTPVGESRDKRVEGLQKFWECLGGRVFFASPDRHDEVVASISHLPHLLSAALVRNSLQDRAGLFADLVGGGFRDTTRIAAGAPEMWAEIMVANQESLLKELDGLISELGDWKEALANLDKENLLRFLSEAKECREQV